MRRRRRTDLQGWVKLPRDTSIETVIIPTAQPQLDTRVGFKNDKSAGERAKSPFQDNDKFNISAQWNRMSSLSLGS